MNPATKISSAWVDSALANDDHLRDFGIFVLCLWAALDLPMPTRVQIDIARYLHHGPRRRMVKAFRGVGKSWLTAAYVLWRLCRNRNERVLVVSAANDRAMQFTRFVRRLLEDVPWLSYLIPAAGQADSVLMFEVAGAEPHQSPSVKSASITGQVTGSRATLIVGDDIEIPRNSQTVKLREQLAEQVKEFDAILLPGGEIIYLGTDQTEMSLYKQLPGRGYDVKVWPARIPELDKVPTYAGHLGPCIQEMIDSGVAELSPSDGDRFDNQDLLEREASYGRSGFAMQFMLDPSLGDADRYPLRCSDFVVLDTTPQLVPTQVVWGSDPKLQVIQDLECMGLGSDRWHRPLFVGEHWSAPDEVVMFVDPSGRGRDETAAAVVAGFGPMLFLHDVGAWLNGYDEETLKGIVEMARKGAVTTVICEPTFGGGMFTKALQSAMVKYQYGCSVVDGEYPRSQKERRIIDTLEPVLVQHRLVVSRSVIEKDIRQAAEMQKVVGDRAHEYLLVHQLSRLTAERDSLKHDDRVEAVAGAVGYFVDSQDRGVEDAQQAYLDQLKDVEIEKFLAEFEQRDPSPDVWVPAR
jgi:hypothetical protein